MTTHSHTESTTAPTGEKSRRQSEYSKPIEELRVNEMYKNLILTHKLKFKKTYTLNSIKPLETRDITMLNANGINEPENRSQNKATKLKGKRKRGVTRISDAITEIKAIEPNSNKRDSTTAFIEKEIPNAEYRTIDLFDYIDENSRSQIMEQEPFKLDPNLYIQFSTP